MTMRIYTAALLALGLSTGIARAQVPQTGWSAPVYAAPSYAPAPVWTPPVTGAPAPYMAPPGTPPGFYIPPVTGSVNPLAGCCR